MSETKRGSGRPKTGVRFPRRLMVYESERGMDLIEAIAKEWDTTHADAVRRLVRMQAKEMGIATSPEEEA